MSVPHTLTIRFEIHDGDVTEQFLWPLGQTAITEVVQASFDGPHNEWTVAGEAGGVPFIGKGPTKKEAILNFLRARLGMDREARDG